MMFFCSVPFKASHSIILAKTPMSPHRFHRLYSVFGGPYSRGASHHLKPLAIDEDYAAQNPPLIDARISMALRKERFQTLHLIARQPE